MNRLIGAALVALLAQPLAYRAVNGQSHSTQRRDPHLLAMRPEQWSLKAAHLKRCEIATVPPQDDALALSSWRIDSLAGTIALPRVFRLLPRSGSKGRGYQWIGPDSSGISLEGIWALGGLAVSGGVVHDKSTCAAQLFRRKVPAEEFALLRKAHGDTLYLSFPGAIVRKGQGIQVMIQAHSAERRAQLLEYAESLELARP